MIPTGLPSPRVENRDLAQWIEIVSQRLQQIDGAVSGVQRSVAGGGSGTSTVTPTPIVPSLSTPPKPVQVNAIGGIGKNAVTWGNPFRQYVNHAQAHVFRAEADDFPNSVEIGQAPYVLFVDENVVAGTAYWYWVRFESTASLMGDVSDPATATASDDPETVIPEITREVLESPLARQLYADIDSPQAVEAEIRGYASLLSVLLAEAQESLSDENATAIRALQAASGGTLGPEENEFAGADRAAAEMARDAYAMANPVWLAQYDANPDNQIELQF